MAGRAVRFGARLDREAMSRALRDCAVRLLRDTSGASAIEYGLFVLLMVVGCFTLLLDTGKSTSDTFAVIDTALSPRRPDPAAGPQAPPRPQRMPLPTLGGPRGTPGRPVAPAPRPASPRPASPDGASSGDG